MFAQGIIFLLVVVGFAYLVYKFIIEPRLPDDKDLPEGIKILQEKIDKLHDLREELEAARAEKDVTEQLKNVDKEILQLIEEISDIENA